MRLNIARGCPRAWCITATACAFFSLGAGLFAGAQAGQRPSRSVWDGVYTDAQARRGKALYVEACATCHSGGDQAPALFGSDFLRKFDGQTVAVLFDLIKRTMPQDRPASLSAEETADVLAHVLSFSFPAGNTDLDRNPEPLKQIRFDATKPAR